MTTGVNKCTIHFKSLSWVVLFGVFFLFLSAVRAQCPDINGKNQYEQDEVFVLKNLAYGTNKHEVNQMLDLYVPIPVLRRCEEVKLILIIHGGGFEGGNKDQLTSWGYYFAKKGYYTAAINYRLYMSSQSELDEYLMNPFSFFGNEQCNRMNEFSFIDGIYKIDKAWYFAIQDSRAALAFLQNQFETHNKKLESVYAVGQSAGAISALGLGLGQQEDFNAYNPQLEQLYGTIDHRIVYHNDQPKGVDAVISMSGGLFNAHHFLSAQDSVPLLFLHGGRDDVVPLCMDFCDYNERRIYGPLKLAEMADSLALPLDMEMHFWGERSHDLSSEYAAMSTVMMNWLTTLEEEKQVHHPLYVYPENEFLRNCELVEAYRSIEFLRRIISEADDDLNPTTSVYPNPSKGLFNILLPGLDGEEIKVELYDMHGKLVYQQDRKLVFLNETEIDARALDPGIYQMVTRTANGPIETFKLIIEQ